MTEQEHIGSVAMGDTEAATEKHAKDCLSLATIFKHWMDEGRQPTFSGGDMRHIIKTLENSAAPQPAHGTSATERVLKPVPYDHEITLQSAKASSQNVDGADPRTVLLAVLGCTETWVGDARIIGNVRAIDIAIAIRAALATPTPKEESK